MVWDYYNYGLQQDPLRMLILLISTEEQIFNREHITRICREQNIKIARRHLDDALDFLVKFGILQEETAGRFHILPNYLREATLSRDPKELLREYIHMLQMKEPFND